MPRPLALTLGEPAGIGPDITFAAWQRRVELALPPFYMIADRDFLERRADRLCLGVPMVAVGPEEAAFAFSSALPVVPLDVVVTAAPGHPDASSGPAAIASIRRGVGHVLSGNA